jgi:glycine/D-amino acid oxidase-like deaminating enzyme
LPPRRAEVVVVGGGVMGASIAFHLTARGVRDVLLLERHGLASGGTRHSTAIVRLHYTQALLVRMAAHGLRTYSAFETAVGARCGFVRTGMLFGVVEADRAGLEANVALGRSLGVSTHVLGPGQLAEIDARVVEGGLAWCYEPEAGYCDPYLAARGFAAAAASAGARIEEGVRVTAVEPGLVRTEAGEVAAGSVVVAAGPWTPALLAPLGYEAPIRATREQIGRFRLPDGFGSAPPAVADFSGPQMYLRPAEPGFLEVGSLDPRLSEEAVDADSIPAGADAGRLSLYRASVERRLAGAAGGHWRGSWSGVYDVTPDWEPVIGAVPGAAGVLVAAGFSGHGFKLAPAVGQAAAELVCDGRATSFDLGLLDPLRFERGELVGARYGYSVLG